MLQELLSMGMVNADDSAPEKLTAVDPRVVEARVGAQLRSSALRLLEDARSLTELLRPLIAESRLVSGVSDGEPIVRIEGKAAISAVVNEAVQQCARELFTAQPGGGRPKATLQAIHQQTEALLDRGVLVRTLYQHTAWHDGPTRDYVSEMTSLGAQVRTLDEFFDRLIIVDRVLAVIPADTARNEAVLVRDEAVVRFLTEVFERNWQRAKPFQGSRTPTESSQLSEALRETIVRCLIHGDSDNAIAKRIGLSTRAYASHLAKLKAELKAETRFQLGYRLGQLAGSQTSGPGEGPDGTDGA
ncbi:LuxR family transcriptional regulator [Streptomyces sp. NPDC004286]|uniref:LuxR family transcriptional regulator n=1 Tax=Streptomyces sp. NPDC004286 TaxID=3364696 RepID=UPI00368A927F